MSHAALPFGALTPALASAEPNVMAVLIWLAIGAVAVVAGAIVVSVLRRRSDLAPATSDAFGQHRDTDTGAIVRAA